jgi:hypothetical protein
MRWGLESRVCLFHPLARFPQEAFLPGSMSFPNIRTIRLRNRWFHPGNLDRLR